MPTTQTPAVHASNGPPAGGPPVPRPHHAVVVGAGIGGLAAAVALRRVGWEVRVVERAPVLGEVGAGLSLWANGLAALGRLGLGDAARAWAGHGVSAPLRTWRGEVLVRPAAAPAALGGPLVVVLHRAALHGLLLDAVGAERVRCGAPCVAARDTGDAAEVVLADGTVERGDVVVGADGLHSVVRAALHGAAPPRYAGYTSWRAIADPWPEPAPTDAYGEWWGHGARFGAAPLADGRTYWYATQDAPPGGHSPDGERAALLRTFGHWGAPVADLVTATPEAAILRTDIADRPPLTRWGRGRVTLLGDAAHPMTPNLGQGACQALEDAVVLAAALAARPNDVPGALAAYDARRRPRANAYVRDSRRVGAVGQWRVPVAVAARTVLARHLLGRAEARAVKRLLAHGLPERLGP